MNVFKKLGQKAQLASLMLLHKTNECAYRSAVKRGLTERDQVRYEAQMDDIRQQLQEMRNAI